MNRPFIIALGVCSLPLVSQATFQIARGTGTITASVIGTYDSNLFGAVAPSPGESADDFLLTLQPAVNYRRETGLIRQSFNASLGVKRYADKSNLDGEDKNLGLGLDFAVGEEIGYSVSLNANYSDTTNVSQDVNSRVNTASTGIQLSGRLGVTRRSTFTGRLGYSRSDSERFSDQKVYVAGAGYILKEFLGGTTLGIDYTHYDTQSSGTNALGAPSLDQQSDSILASLTRPILREVRGRAGLGYRVLKRSAAERAFGLGNQNAPIFTAGVDGPFLPATWFPKIKSSFSISYEDAISPGVNDQGGKTLQGALALDWQARERTSVNFKVDRGLRLSIEDKTIASTSISGGISQAIGENGSVSASTFYRYEDTVRSNRADDVYGANVSYNHNFAARWQAALAYSYVKSSSNVSVGNYDRNIVSLTGSFIF